MNIEAAIEALLFIHGEPLEIKKIAQLLNVKEADVLGGLNKIKERCDQEAVRGLTLIGNQKAAQLITKPALAGLVKNIIKEEFSEELTPSAAETLSVIAYGGPLAKIEIDQIRGVNSSHIIRILLLRGLIARDDKKYSVSFDFLKNLGVGGAAELPQYEEHRRLLKNFSRTYEIS